MNNSTMDVLPLIWLLSVSFTSSCAMKKKASVIPVATLALVSMYPTRSYSALHYPTSVEMASFRSALLATRYFTVWSKQEEFTRFSQSSVFRND